MLLEMSADLRRLRWEMESTRAELRTLKDELHAMVMGANGG
jgi:hypothetical protein